MIVLILGRKHVEPMRFQTRVEGKPSRVRLTDGEERAVTETYRTIAPR